MHILFIDMTACNIFDITTGTCVHKSCNRWHVLPTAAVYNCVSRSHDIQCVFHIMLIIYYIVTPYVNVHEKSIQMYIRMLSMTLETQGLFKLLYFLCVCRCTDGYSGPTCQMKVVNSSEKDCTYIIIIFVWPIVCYTYYMYVIYIVYNIQ